MKAAHLVAAGIALATGAAAWYAVGEATGKREAWDTPVYFSIVMPVFALVSFGLGIFAPGRATLIALAMAAGQFLALLVQNGLGSLFPIGIAFFLVLGLPNAAAAWAGGRLFGGRRAT